MLITVAIILICYVSMFFSFLILGSVMKLCKISYEKVKDIYIIIWSFINYFIISYSLLYLIFLRQ